MAGRRNKNAAVKKRLNESRVIVGIEDMVLLHDTKDTGICENLKTRLRAEHIYTFIGHVLVACNPYKWLPIYEEHVMKQYVMQQRVDVAPHIFATAEAAYRSMIQEEDNQCVIISGESGAGKTEASKQIQSYIASVSGGGGSVDNIKKVFLESNPVLEAFGNAKTLRNNNSSRFGKYFELKFDRFGCPVGGLITNYLLEKSRICRPGEGERNFHVFYQILNSPFAQTYDLDSIAQSTAYLTCSACRVVDGVDDKAEFDVTIAAMRAVGMKNPQIKSIMALVAAVLHFGNIQFQPKQVEGAEGSKIVKGPSLRKCCELLQIGEAELEGVLTFRELQTMAPGGKVETFQVPQNTVQAAARRDALSKAIYERLFNLIVKRINVALDPEKERVNLDGTVLEALEASDMLSIGVLDIYGFEVFENNGFEQLCINYVNEKLQQIFIELTLHAEQLEYESEGIAWTPIPFFNNKIVCELLDGTRPPGLFRVLDDTCKTMHGTKEGPEVDRKFLETAQQVVGNHKHFGTTTSYFFIKHYAGEVKYKLGKLAESNKDALNSDLLLLLSSSGDKLMQHLFPREEAETLANERKSTVPSAGNRIRVQCGQLVTSLMQCTPHYVRCIKSNDQKASLSVDQARVVHQIKYLGLSENIKVRRAGFAYRAEYHRFLDRFSILSPKTYPEWRGTDMNGCKEILKAIHKDMPIIKDEAQCGRTKLFIRKPETYFALEKLLDSRKGFFVERIQKAWRRYFGKRAHNALQSAVNALYVEETKARRRDSIFRPFSAGDYLDALPSTIAEMVRDDMYRIIDYYNSEENVLFADASVFQILSSNVQSVGCTPAQAASISSSGPWQLQSRLLVLTDGAVYIMEIISAEQWLSELRNQKITAEKAMPCSVFLRRRIALRAAVDSDSSSVSTAAGVVIGAGGYLEGVALSKMADSCVVLKVKQPELRDEIPNKDHWLPNNETTTCYVTGVGFTLFHRRHHCRVSGKICSHLASNYRQRLPDQGWGAAKHPPQRVSDPLIGLVSTDPLEDVALVVNRKSEFTGLVATELGKQNSAGNSKSKKNKAAAAAVAEGGGGGAMAKAEAAVSAVVAAIKPVVSFDNRLELRNSGCALNAVKAAYPPTILPANELQFSDNTMPSVPGGSAVAAEFYAAVNDSKMVIFAPKGLSQQVLRDRRARLLEQQKKAEVRRRKEDKARARRREEREVQREEERMRRLAEKKAKKAADRHAAKEAEENKLAESSAKASGRGGGIIGGQGSLKASAGSRGNSMSPNRGGRETAAAPAAQSSAASELAAAMAKRRAKNG